MKKLTKKQLGEIESYQTWTADAAENLNDLADKADEFFEGRSEQWQESDAGQAYDTWRTTLRTAAESMQTAADDVQNVPEAPEEG